MFKHSNQKICFAITGGGTEFLSEVLSAGGASSWFVDAVIPYSNESLEAFVGGVREKCCSEATARQLCVAAEAKGRVLGYDAIGIGATCSLHKEGERKGRDHKIFVAAKYKEYCVSLEWINKDLGLTIRDKGCVLKLREAEECIAAHLIKHVSEIFSEYISNKSHSIKCELNTMMRGLFVMNFSGDITINYPTSFAKQAVAKTSGASFYDEEIFKKFYNSKRVCVYPGSFALVHDDHERVFRKCEELYGADNSFFEISISNFSKQPIDSIELSNRISQLRKITKNIIITNSANFVDKIKDFGGRKIVFACGFDTFRRVELIHNASVSFLVFPRDGKAVCEEAPGEYRNNVELESFNLIEGSNLSSSAILKNNA